MNASTEKIASVGKAIGCAIGSTCEFLWTIFKIVVVVGIVTGVVGFLLSRSLMIRGRNGARQATNSMMIATTTKTTKAEEEAKVKEWLTQIKREKVTMISDDEHIMVARKIVVNEGNRWAIILHGYNGSMADIYDIAMHYEQEGYNILMPDLRACGESEGSFIGMGWLDRLDIINWVDVILKENPSADVVIHGIDMGADAALMLTGDPIKASIKAIVAEGAYTSAWEAVKKEYSVRYEGKPVFPFMNMMNPVAKVWGGYSLKEANAIKQVSQSNIPILLIYGANDTFTTPEMASQIEGAIVCTHEMLTVPSGTHEDCRYAEPETYYKKTFAFLENYVK